MYYTIAKPPKKYRTNLHRCGFIHKKIPTYPILQDFTIQNTHVSNVKTFIFSFDSSKTMIPLVDR